MEKRRNLTSSELLKHNPLVVGFLDVVRDPILGKPTARQKKEVLDSLTEVYNGNGFTIVPKPEEEKSPYGKAARSLRNLIEKGRRYLFQE